MQFQPTKLVIAPFKNICNNLIIIIIIIIINLYSANTIKINIQKRFTIKRKNYIKLNVIIHTLKAFLKIIVFSL